MQISIACRVVNRLILSRVIVRLLVRVGRVIVLVLWLLLLVVRGVVVVLLGVRIRVLIVHILVVHACSTVAGHTGCEVVLGNTFNASGMVELGHELLPLSIGISMRGGALQGLLEEVFSAHSILRRKVDGLHLRVESIARLELPLAEGGPPDCNKANDSCGYDDPNQGSFAQTTLGRRGRVGS